jgi:hypothetical protein
VATTGPDEREVMIRMGSMQSGAIG